MVLYARSDITRISLPVGVGCGVPHQRPQRDDDSYVRIWGIDCPVCEANLETDVLWSKSRNRIPLSPDEEEETRELNEQAKRIEERARLEMTKHALAAAQGSRGAVDDGDPDDIAVTKSEAVPVPPGGVRNTSAADYNAMTKGDLKDLARDRGLGVGGTKDDLVARHLDHDATKE